MIDQYLCSIQQFVANSGDYAIKMVDDLLDLLTGGEHSKTKNTIAEVSVGRLVCCVMASNFVGCTFTNLPL